MREPANNPPPSLPGPLVSRHPLAWLALFGPGAIIASLTIGTGELIFSTRGGALFGYRVLFLFIFVSLLKWCLVFSTARHMVLCGVHPYRRMMDLPGPRGWLTLLFLLLAIPCYPIWVSFHSGVTGNFIAWVTGTQGMLNGGVDYLWGGVVLLGVLFLASTSGYAAMEKIQMLVVVAMVGCAIVALVIHQPDWIELLKGTFIPQSLHYPEWLPKAYPEIARHSEWVETSRYIGVIGGASYDYLAYTTFLREKHWGNASGGGVSRSQLDALAENPRAAARLWVRAPLIDLALSFLLVIVFSTVFVVSGVMVLGPQHKIPDEAHLLDLQAQFVTSIHPALLPLYIAAALLTMLGTVYGTVEIACAISKETGLALVPHVTTRYQRQIRLGTIACCAVLAMCILALNFLHRIYSTTSESPRILLSILTPANLFTGVLGCGIICALNPWFDWRNLPRSLWMPRLLVAVNLFAAVAFIAIGLKGYYDHESRFIAIGGLAAVTILSLAIASLRQFPISAPANESAMEIR